MARRRRAAAGGMLVLSLVAGAATGQAPQSGSVVDSSERRPASPAQLAIPKQVPSGNAERGRYLVLHVAMCVECHSPRDARGELLAGREFTGASIPFQPPQGWALRAPRNRGLPGYTPELAVRLLTQGGVDREGRQLRAPMPRFRMSFQDAADVVAYLRSLP
jgi:mono/diheme cytochrome c family protein